MAHILDTRPERLNALRVLTGGNPRATVMLYELFASGADDSGQSDLKVLLDIMTPLYMARMDALGELPRKLFAHLMENWHPMGVRELEQVSGVKTNTLSGQLAKLEAAGLVEKTRLAGPTKRSGYQAAERLFNVWHLMRSGSRRVRQRLAWLVEFMRMWYSRDELDRVATQRSQRHGRGELSDGDSLEYSRAVAAAMGERGLALEWSVMSAAHRESNRTRQSLTKLIPGLLEPDGTHAEFTSAPDYLKRFDALEAKLRLCPHVQGDAANEWVAAVKGSLGLSLEQKEEVANAAKTFNQLQFEGFFNLLQKGTTHLQKSFGHDSVVTVQAAVLEGNFFPDCVDSKLAFVQMEYCFASHAKAYRLALALIDAKHHDSWVEKAYRRAIEFDEKNVYRITDLAQFQAMHGDRGNANLNYRKVLVLLLSNDDNVHIRLQAHLWLGNRDLATQALDGLAQAASTGESRAFLRLREQCWNCHAMGLGPQLAELIEASAWEAFLLPFSLALRAAASGELPQGAAPEVLTLAGEVLKELRATQTVIAPINP